MNPDVGSARPGPAGTIVHSRNAQIAAVVVAFAALAVLHAGNDGLWFGDAPLHAGSGLFWWDLLATTPGHPVDYAVRYFARYPIVQPTTYPPLFYLVEGAAFAVAGASPTVAKLLVLPCGMVIGVYTVLWGRRWIGEAAGWTGVFLAFVPGILTWSNAVMLNVPATALGLAAFYHFRRWLDTGAIRQAALGAALMAAVMLTYYPGAVVLGPMAALAAIRWRDVRARVDRRLLWIPAATVCAALPLAASVLLSPVHTSRHVPSLAFLMQPTTWLLYWMVLPIAIGWPAIVLGAAGAAAGVLESRWRSEVVVLIAWFAVLIVGLSLQPARDPRYILLAAPAFVLAAAIGAGVVVNRVRVPSVVRAAALLIALAGGAAYAVRVDVPEKTGFREIASFLERAAPQDAVLYDGPNAALVAFYMRLADPGFERRLTEGGMILYHYGPGRTFRDWTQSSNVATPADVVTLLRNRCGCRWVAVEDWPQTAAVTGRLLLREALAGPQFELVRSFPVTGAHARRVDLYRLTGDVAAVPALDLSFPAFSTREFRGVVPVTR